MGDRGGVMGAVSLKREPKGSTMSPLTEGERQSEGVPAARGAMLPALELPEDGGVGRPTCWTLTGVAWVAMARRLGACGRGCGVACGLPAAFGVMDATTEILNVDAT